MQIVVSSMNFIRTAAVGHEILGELVEALNQRRPRPLPRQKQQRVAVAPNLDFLALDVKFFRNPHGLAVPTRANTPARTPSTASPGMSDT
jgi:hypothetical protein